jgi:hypothetical protein
MPLQIQVDNRPCLTRKDFALDHLNLLYNNTQVNMVHRIYHYLSKFLQNIWFDLPSQNQQDKCILVDTFLNIEKLKDRASLHKFLEDRVRIHH